MLALFALFYALSGFTFLSAEVVMIREMGLRTGATPLSASWILMTYFLFAALGARLAGKTTRTAPDAARRYGLVELVVAAALLLAYLCREPVFKALFLNRPWEFAYALYLLAVPSLLSGMTLPLLGDALATGEAPQRSRRAGFLYAANLAGAALGIPLGGVYLPWKFGYADAVYAIVALLALTGGAAIYASRWVKAPVASKAAPMESKEEQPVLAKWAGCVMIASGVLTLATEILAIGYFQIIAEESLYSYSAVLLVFILGLTLGAAVAAIWRPSLTWVLVGTAALMLLTPLCLHWAFVERDMLAADEAPIYYTRLTLVAGLVLLPLLALQGAVFPLAWSLLKKHLPAGAALGHFLLLNKLGSAVGVILAGYFLLRWLDSFTAAFATLAAAYCLLGLVGMRIAGKSWPRLGLIFLGLLVIAGLGLQSREPIDLAKGETLLGQYYGRSDLVTVIEDQLGSRHIRINQSYTLNGTDRAMRTQQLEAWLPLVLNPEPKRVLFIGMASGISASAVLEFSVAELTAVELSPEVVHAARAHFSQWNATLFTDERATVRVDDGRHLLAQEGGWDLIIGDLFNPVRAGASQLYSRDYFELARDHLSDTGQVWSWIPAYQFDEPMMAATLRAFADTFDHAVILRGNFDPQQPVVALVGCKQPIDLTRETLQARLDVLPESVRQADAPFLRSVDNLRLALIGDLHSPAIEVYLAEFAPNTDDAPLLAFRGPRRFGPGELLRGVNLLQWGGNRFTGQEMPSVWSPYEPSIANAQRAGNHFYAAAMMSIPIPGASAQQNAERQQRARYHWGQAHALLPDTDLQVDDLGQ